MANVVPFMEAQVGDEAYTYRDDEGLTDYGWVTDLEYYDERDCEIKLRRQRWLLVCDEQYVLADPYPVEDDDEVTP